MMGGVVFVSVFDTFMHGVLSYTTSSHNYQHHHIYGLPHILVSLIETVQFSIYSA